MNIVNNSSEVEQEICIKCGFCCDGTLFDTAALKKGEKEFLPALLQNRYIGPENRERFKLPCPYFDKKCTIYDQKKVYVCSAFRCQLLKSLSKGKINQRNAEDIVKNAHELRNEIFMIYKTISKSNLKPCFRELLYELRKKNDANIADNIKDLQIELLLFKCYIFELLLIKHFQSSKEFESFIME